MSAPGRAETRWRRIVRIGVGVSFLGAGATWWDDPDGA